MKAQKTRRCVSLQLPKKISGSQSAPELLTALAKERKERLSWKDSCPELAEQRRANPVLGASSLWCNPGVPKRVVGHNAVLRQLTEVEPAPGLSKLGSFRQPEQRQPRRSLYRNVKPTTMDLFQDTRDREPDVVSPICQQVGRRRISVVPETYSATGTSAAKREEVLQHLRTMLNAKLANPSLQGPSTDILARLTGEVSEDLCSLNFTDDGIILDRLVTVHSLNLVREEDDHVLCQVGKWRPRHGLLPRTSLPGGKRRTNDDFDQYIHYLLRAELAELIGSREVEMAGSRSETQAKESAQYGIPTKYHLLVQHAVMKSNRQGRKMLRASISAELDSDALPLILYGYKLHAMVRDHQEVDLYAWLPADLADCMASNCNAKQLIKNWVSNFEDQAAQLSVSDSGTSASWSLD